MNEPRWRMSLTVQGVEPERGVSVPVAVGLWETAAGGVQVAVQVGDGPVVILALRDAGQLELNVRETLAERFRVTAARLGGEES